MEAQKLSQKSGSPKTVQKSGSKNGSPKTFQKSGSQNGSPNTFQKKWFPKWKPKNFPKKVVPNGQTWQKKHLREGGGRGIGKKCFNIIQHMHSGKRILDDPTLGDRKKMFCLLEPGWCYVTKRFGKSGPWRPWRIFSKMRVSEMFSKVQTFLGSTDGGVPNLFLYPDSLLKQGGVTKIYFMNLRKHEIKIIASENCNWYIGSDSSC